MKQLLLSAAVLWLSLQFSTGSHDLSVEYTFSAALHDDYTLYWNYDLTEESISFAVRVRTEGWVGFGISPTGQMPGSDVVIGWVDEQGNTSFHDRFAEGRFTPAIDDSQDWDLEFGEQENGYTILAFSRPLTSCDPNDLNIEVGTSPIVWSWHSNDPTDENTFQRHQFSGSTSVNLLGGLSKPRPEPNDKDSFTITSQNVVIPNDSDTTYWCTPLQLPPQVRETTRYIYKVVPFISESSKAYVHHIVITLCSKLNHSLVGQGSLCSSGNIIIDQCRSESIIGAWAYGGEEFVFPEDVGMPIGGIGNREYVIIEMHYDNPLLDQGVVDSSGLEFFYTSVEPLHKAGTLGFGHWVRPSMIIPPNTENFLVEGFCHSSCTQKFLPPDGITVFGSLLHTHIHGQGLRVRHFRHNEECNATEELKPLDENMRYDFNYQNFIHLSPEVKLMPGDSLLLQCFYSTVTTDTPVLGGESTRDEMCVGFVYYYPVVDLTSCFSSAQAPLSFSTFADKYIEESKRESLLSGLANDNITQFLPILDEVNWTPDAVESFRNSTLNVPQAHVCFTDLNSFEVDYKTYPPQSECPYEEPDSCSGFQPKTCCERVKEAREQSVTDNGKKLVSNTILSTTLILLYAAF